MTTKRDLFEKIFEKAKLECGSTTKNALSNYLEEKIWNDYNFQISSKSFSRYYDDFNAGKIIERNISPEFLNYLAKYIGYSSYAKFYEIFDTVEKEKLELQYYKAEKNNFGKQQFNYIQESNEDAVIFTSNGEALFIRKSKKFFLQNTSIYAPSNK